MANKLVEAVEKRNARGFKTTYEEGFILIMYPSYAPSVYDLMLAISIDERENRAFSAEDDSMDIWCSERIALDLLGLGNYTAADVEQFLAKHGIEVE